MLVISGENKMTSTEIERGNDEEAFYLRDSDTTENRIIHSLSYKDCPVIKCGVNFGRRNLPFRMLYEHFVHTHYNPGRKGRLENFCYSFESSDT